MNRNTALAGLAATVAAVAITAPAAQAQEIIAPDPTPTPTPVPFISPANPAVPNAGPAVRFGQCKVARSAHGYTYAVCSISADDVPYLQTVGVGYASSLKTFTPRTKAKWATQRGTLSLTNDMDGEAPGPGTITGTVKLAFKGLSAAQVRSSLVLASTGATGAAVLQPIATTV
ncbi:hypothetical protein C8N24_2876 [Solirubrobacter pauli]|uniref:Uncharacterized protein n=1 Tax=Solirubrobacter pauli TaxID=166793 RepID=A0A660LD89_9ACTN|nr:hypothetical protein [Solirubrobacter pauli]RKQ93017.1 hypothetical protein C8N24_2876 [Solirubrobacter pauli]